MNKNPIKHPTSPAEGFTHPPQLIPPARPPIKQRLLNEKQQLEERLAKVNSALKAFDDPKVAGLVELVLETIQ